jgi:hypothetical protein
VDDLIACAPLAFGDEFRLQLGDRDSHQALAGRVHDGGEAGLGTYDPEAGVGVRSRARCSIPVSLLTAAAPRAGCSRATRPRSTQTAACHP